MNKVSGIYGIRSISHPERVYIGSAVDIKVRWYRHQRLLMQNKHHSYKLQNHFNKYGSIDLIFEIIIKCDKLELINIEQKFINIYNPWFNICQTVGSPLGVHPSTETRKKLSNALMGNKHMLGKHPSEETRKKLREACKQRKPLSQEAIQRIRDANTGKSVSEKTKNKMKAAQKRRRLRELKNKF
jgi:group I intron endonuclease